MRTTATRTLALAAATALILTACGADGSDDTDEPDAGSVTTTPASGTDGDGSSDGDGLRAPVPVEVSAEATTGGRLAADSAGPSGELLGAEADLGIMPWFGGWEFVVDPSMPALPDRSIGYELPAGIELDSAAVARIAAALGVDGEPTVGSEAEGLRWRVGPDDGTAPSLIVIDDGPLSWYRSNAWALDVGRWDCVVEVAPADEMDGTGEPDDPAVVTTVEPTEWEVCEEPSPPVGVPTAAEAEAEARRMLGEMGLDDANVDVEVWADEWYASVTVWPEFDGVRWPLGFGFGFGAEGELEWANGFAATPVPAGPYPLIGLDEALDRLDAPMWWGVEAARTMIGTDLAADSDMGDGDMVESDAAPGTADDVEGEIPREVATLVDVRADLWWAGTADGTVWLLPAYTFVDTEGRWHTVPAVTDDFLVVEEPIIMIDPPMIDPPIGDDDRTDDHWVDEPEIDLAEFEGLIGLGVEEAEEVLAEQSRTLRVLRVDGVDQPATMDYAPSRINVAVEGGVVSEILSNG